MNKDQFQGAWKQISGKVKEKWGKLTDDEITQINGKREALLGLIQQKYGIAKERAEDELSRFESSINWSGSKPSQAGYDKPHASHENNPSKKDNQKNREHTRR